MAVSGSKIVDALNKLTTEEKALFEKDSENISLKTENQKLQERIKELEKDYKELEDKYEILYAHQADY